MRLRHTTSGEVMLTEVRNISEALEALKEMGVEADTQGVLPIYVQDYWTHLPKSKGYIHLYFFGRDGRETAYYTPLMGNVLVHTTPREWHQTFKEKLENPALHQG